jgi:hypothetical protein
VPQELQLTQWEKCWFRLKCVLIGVTRYESNALVRAFCMVSSKAAVGSGTAEYCVCVGQGIHFAIRAFVAVEPALEFVLTSKYMSRPREIPSGDTRWCFHQVKG